MVHRICLAASVVVLALLVGGLNAAHGQVQAGIYPNYYTAPGYGGVAAELYPCPRPTPPLVGHTQITYPPLAPHEFLYQHKRSYYTTNANGGRSVTHARWGWNPLLSPSRLRDWPRDSKSTAHLQHF